MAKILTFKLKKELKKARENKTPISDNMTVKDTDAIVFTWDGKGVFTAKCLIGCVKTLPIEQRKKLAKFFENEVLGLNNCPE